MTISIVLALLAAPPIDLSFRIGTVHSVRIEVTAQLSNNTEATLEAIAEVRATERGVSWSFRADRVVEKGPGDIETVINASGMKTVDKGHVVENVPADARFEAFRRALLSIEFDHSGTLLKSDMDPAFNWRFPEVDYFDDFWLGMPIPPSHPVALKGTWRGTKFSATQLGEFSKRPTRMRYTLVSVTNGLALVDIRGTATLLDFPGPSVYEIRGSARISIADGRWLDSELAFYSTGKRRELWRRTTIRITPLSHP